MVAVRAFDGRRLANLIRFAAAGITASIMVATPASAYDSASWNPFADTVSSYTQPYDRTFVREWEANPPRGYPTISPANIEPMKAAIKRYAAIVEQGGWKPVPSVRLQVGMTDRAVRILRERLLMSGDLR